MGLDIYFYKTKESKETINETYNFIEQQQQEVITKLVNDVLNNTISKVEFLSCMTPYIRYGFQRNELSEWLDLENQDVKTEKLNNFIKYYCVNEDLYFRKVNFIYGYFADKLENEQCWVDKEELEDIVNSCKEILDQYYDESAEDNSKAIELAKELLPTTNGFFFGSTEYDEYYFNDLEDVAYKLEMFLGELEDDESIFVVMSW